MNQKRTAIIGCLILFVVITIGYALFSETVTIGGTLKAEGNLSIIFTNPGAGGNRITVKEIGTHGADVRIENSGKKLNIQIPNMDYPTSYVEIPIRIKNNGSIGGFVKKITPENLNTDDIKVTYTGISESDKLNPNDEKDVLIKVEWDENSNKNVKVNFNLIIDFEQVVLTENVPDVPPKVYAVGEEVCLNGQEDCFNVIKDNGDSISMLAKNVLAKDGLTQTTSTNLDIYGVPFANQIPNKKPENYYAYWTDDNGNLLAKYGGDPSKNDSDFGYPANVYDSNSYVYGVINTYVLKLKTIKNISDGDEVSIKGDMGSEEELIKINIPDNNSWFANGQNWWSPAAASLSYVHIFDSDYLWNGDAFFLESAGVRPVITILKSKI